MSTAIESGLGAINYGKQSAKGTKATAATTTIGYNRPKWVSGTLAPKKIVASEEYLDGNRFASPTPFTDRVGGDVGELTIQVQPENGGLFLAQILGSDVVTGATDPYTHTIASSGTSGAWGTWWQKVGSSVGPVRELYWDSKISRYALDVGRDQKVMHGTLGIMSLVSGEIFTTDPGKTEDTSDPFYWTEVTGAVTFDGTVVSESHGETLEIDTGMEAHYGDDVAPNQLIEKKGTITRTLQTIVTDATLLKYRKAVYNTTAPTAGTVPVKDVFSASLATVYTKSATRTLTLTTPNMIVRPDDMSVAPSPDGGALEMTFGGECRKSGATAALTAVALTADSTAY